MIILGYRPAVVAGHVGDQLDLICRKSSQVAVLDQIVRVLVVLAGVDEGADVVEGRGVFQPFPLARAHLMDGGSLIEELKAQLRNVVRMDGFLLAPPARRLSGVSRSRFSSSRTSLTEKLARFS